MIRTHDAYRLMGLCVGLSLCAVVAVLVVIRLTTQRLKTKLIHEVLGAGCHVTR